MFNKRLRALAFFSLIGFAATGLAQDKLNGRDKKWMEKEVGPIITKQEIAMFQQVSKNDRKLFKDLFWMRRDYDRSRILSISTSTMPRSPRRPTKGNEFKKSYEARVDVADKNFKIRGTKGSESDMGKIFLLLGNPSQQQRGRSADAAGLPGGGGGGGGGPGGANPAGDGAGVDAARLNRGGGTSGTTWVYDPNPQMGIPDGLAVEFRNQGQFGMRLANGDDIAERLERVKERLITNPGINYARDEKGRLKKPDNKFDPNSPAKLLLASLRETGEISTDIDFTLSPVFFRSSAGQIFIPIDVVISEGLNGEDVTIFGSVENADGFEIYQFEEPATVSKTKGGRHAYELPLQFPPGLYTLYVGLLDESQVHGTQIMDLEVPDFDSGELKISSMLLFSEAERSGETSGMFGNAFVLGGYHFTPKREMVLVQRQNLPEASLRLYTTKDQFSGVFNAYNFGVEGDKPDLTVQVRFFKDGKPRGQTKEEPFMLQSAEVALTIFDIPLSIPNFKDPGVYRIEVHVIDKIKGERLKEEFQLVIEG